MRRQECHADTFISEFNHWDLDKLDEKEKEVEQKIVKDHILDQAWDLKEFLMKPSVLIAVFLCLVILL